MGRVTQGTIGAKYQNPSFKPIKDIVYSEGGTIRMEVTTDNPGILVLSESFYPGWRVRVDGVERECLRLNYLFQGVALEKGRHQVVFKYRPRNLTLFLSISACSLLMLLVGWVGLVVRNRRK